MFKDLVPYHVGERSRWTTVRLGGVCHVFKANGGSKDDDAEAGVPCVRYGDLYTRFGTAIRRVERRVRADVADRYTRVVLGDLLFAASGETIEEIGRCAVNLVIGDVRASGDIIVARPRGDVAPEFLALAVDTPAARRHRAASATGTVIVHLGGSAIKTLRVDLPSLREQAAIVKYLAHAHRRIDLAIAAKRKMIALLEEQKQAIINQAVTRGLDSRARLLKSDNPWIALVPAGWSVMRLKGLIGPIGQGWSPQCDAQVPRDGEWGVLKAGCTNYGRLRPDESKRLAQGLEPRPELQPRRDDILMSRASTLALVGSAALVETDLQRLMISDKIFRFRVTSASADSRFVVRALASRPSRAQIECAASGASHSMQNIGQSVVRELWIAVPPMEEQRDILAFIAAETATADAAIDRTRREIELLPEFRTRLTSEVVTGQLDVRHIAATLPDLDPEESAGDVGLPEDDLVDEAAELMEGVDA